MAMTRTIAIFTSTLNPRLQFDRNHHFQLYFIVRYGFPFLHSIHSIHWTCCQAGPSPVIPFVPHVRNPIPWIPISFMISLHHSPCADSRVLVSPPLSPSSHARIYPGLFPRWSQSLEIRPWRRNQARSGQEKKESQSLIERWKMLLTIYLSKTPTISQKNGELCFLIYACVFHPIFDFFQWLEMDTKRRRGKEKEGVWKGEGRKGEIC